MFKKLSSHSTNHPKSVIFSTVPNIRVAQKKITTQYTRYKILLSDALVDSGSPAHLIKDPQVQINIITKNPTQIFLIKFQIAPPSLSPIGG